MRAQLKSLLIAVIFLLAPLGAFSQDSRATLSVLGDVQQPSQWSVEELKAKFSAKIQDIKFTAGMDKSVSIGTGIPLLSLIQAAAPKAEKGTKHPDLAFLVIVEAYDSYRVFFSLAELMPQAGHAQAWLLWSIDGKPLSGKEAPFRLFVSTDQGHDRNIFGVTKITLVDGVKLANQLKLGQ